MSQQFGQNPFSGYRVKTTQQIRREQLSLFTDKNYNTNEAE